MFTHNDKAKEKGSKAVANGFVKQQPHTQTAQLQVSRPEDRALVQLQEIANFSRQVVQLKAYQEMATMYQCAGHPIQKMNKRGAVVQLLYTGDREDFDKTLQPLDVQALLEKNVTVLGKRVTKGGNAGIWHGMHDGVKVAIKGMDEGRASAQKEYAMMLAAPVGTTARPIAQTGSLIVMELIEGTPGHLVPKGDFVQALEIISDVAIQVAALHQKSIAHGDIKPKNIIRTNEGPTRLIDFGNAREIPDGSTKVDEASYSGDLRMIGRLLESLAEAPEEEGKQDEPDKYAKELEEVKKYGTLLSGLDKEVGQEGIVQVLRNLLILVRKVKSMVIEKHQSK